MSVTALAGPARLPRAGRRLLVAALALAVVGGVCALVAALGFAVAAPAIAPRNPFGTGLREAAPAFGGFGEAVLALQSRFYRLLTGALATLKREGTGLPALVAVGFAYGVFHAAGPGHGKAVISGYLLASRRTLGRGWLICLASALLQAGVAAAVVGILSVWIGATARTVDATANAVEIASFAAVALVGLGLLWRRTGRLVPAAGPGGAADAIRAPGAARTEACCAEPHMPDPGTVARLSTWREAAGIVAAAGMRPCSGAIILLVFAVSQGLIGAGLAAIGAMALGTALTTGLLASLAVFAKGVAVRLAASRGPARTLVPVLEIGAAAFVAVVGLALLAAAARGIGTGAG